MQRDLDYYKLIWRNKNEAVKILIIQSLEDAGKDGEPYSQVLYYKKWKKLILDKTGINCDPLDYLRAFSYTTFKDYWEAINGKS